MVYFGKYIPLYQVHFPLPKYKHNDENGGETLKCETSATSLTFNKHGSTTFNKLLYAHLISYLKQAKYCLT